MIRSYIVRSRDYLEQIAFRFGVPADTIWNDPKNEALRARRKDPNLLAPGDILFIPDAPTQPTKRVRVGTTNRYASKTPTVSVSFVLQHEGKPVDNEPFTVLGLVERVHGTTDANGTVRIDVPLDVTQLRVVFSRMKRAFPVNVGELNPGDLRSGLEQRLAHLGYAGWSLGLPPEPISTTQSETREMIARFQQKHDLGVSKAINEETQQLIAKEHPV